MMEKEKPKNLVSKLAEITAEMQWIKKAGKNKFHDYEYATESDISDKVREVCGKHNVWLQFSMMPDTLRYEYFESKKGEARVRTIFVGKVTIHDGDSEEKIESIWPAFSHDSDDKGANKAMTAFAKYAMIRTFSISTGIDPDAGADGKMGTANEKPASKNGHGPSPISLYHRAVKAGIVTKKEDFRAWFMEHVPLCDGLQGNALPNAEQCLAIETEIAKFERVAA